MINRSQVQILLGALLRNNLRQVVHTYVPLSPSSITWYRPNGNDAVRLGRQPQAWWKVMAAYRRVDDLCTLGSAPGPTLSIEYGKPLPFSVLSQEIGWEERLQNDVFCVEWDVNIAAVTGEPHVYC